MRVFWYKNFILNVTDYFQRSGYKVDFVLFNNHALYIYTYIFDFHSSDISKWKTESDFQKPLRGECGPNVTIFHHFLSILWKKNHSRSINSIRRMFSKWLESETWKLQTCYSWLWYHKIYIILIHILFIVDVLNFFLTKNQFIIFS